MTSGETLIALLLGVIAWLLYQIVKQLSYMTGKRITFSQSIKFKPKSKSHQKQEDPVEKLPN